MPPTSSIFLALAAALCSPSTTVARPSLENSRGGAMHVISSCGAAWRRAATTDGSLLSNATALCTIDSIAGHARCHAMACSASITGDDVEAPITTRLSSYRIGVMILSISCEKEDEDGMMG